MFLLTLFLSLSFSTTALAQDSCVDFQKNFVEVVGQSYLNYEDIQGETLNFIGHALNLENLPGLSLPRSKFVAAMDRMDAYIEECQDEFGMILLGSCGQSTPEQIFGQFEKSAKSYFEPVFGALVTLQGNVVDSKNPYHSLTLKMVRRDFFSHYIPWMKLVSQTKKDWDQCIQNTGL